MNKQSKSEQPRLWSLMFVLLIVLTFCCFVMGQGLNAGTSVFIVGRGYDSGLAGALALAFSLAAGAVRIFVGPVIDDGKCSLVTICGIAVLVAGTLMCAFVDSIPLFACGRFLQGAGFGAGTTAAATAAASVLPETRLGEGIGYYGLGQAVAMSIGPALALYLVGTDPSTNLYVGLAMVGVVGFFIALNARYERKWRTLPETSACYMKMQAAQGGEEQPHRKRTLKECVDIFEPRALGGAIPMTILCPTFGFGIFFTGLYGTTLGYEHTGMFFTISAIVMVIVRLLSKHFMDTVPAIKIYSFAVVFGIIHSVILLFGGISETLFLSSGIFYGLVLGLSLPLNQSVSVKYTPSERWGAANALFLLCNDVGIGIASLVWGNLNDIFGFQVSILCVIACQVLSYVAAWICYPPAEKKWRK